MLDDNFLLNEALTSKERNALPDEAFALPSGRKFPIHDVEHLKLAMKMFNKCECSEDEKTIIATNIFKKADELGIGINRNADWYRYVDTNLLEAGLLKWAGDDYPENVHIQLEDMFKDVIEKESTLNAMSPSIIKYLKKEFGIFVKQINLIESDNKFFGMRLIPTLAVRDGGVMNYVFNTDKNSVLRIDKGQTEYIIEIDSRLLYDKRIKATPGEVTAVLLHEVGHVFVDDSIIYKLRKAVLEVTNSKIVNNARAVKLFMQYNDRTIRETIIQTAYYNRCLQIVEDEEYVADEFVIRQGYANILNEFIIRLVNLAMLDIQKSKRNKYTENEYHADNKIVIGWGIETINTMNYRSNHINEEVKLMMKQTDNNSYFKNLLSRLNDFLTKFSVSDKIRLTNSAETILNENINVIGASNFKKFQRIIDEIAIEAEDIPDLEYKSYVIRRIHDKLDDINIAYKTARDDRDVDMLNGYHAQLIKLRTKVMDTKIQEKRYGVLVKYPVGYEG